MNKEEVRNFLSKYISEFIFDEDVKSVEGITRKISVDMELVIDDLESIYKFYIEKLGINSTLITLEDLCKTKTGEIWNDLSNLKDLKTLEELLALGIATGVILDDRKMRIEAFYKIGGDCVALNPHLLNLETPEEQLKYMELMKEKVLPNYHFEINKDKVVVETKPHYNEQEIKELLMFWFNNITSISVEEKYSDIFESLLNDNVDRILTAVCLMRLLNKNQEEFYVAMIEDPSLLFIERLNIKYRDFSEESKEYIYDVKKVFLQELHRIKIEYNFRHKKTL